MLIRHLMVRFKKKKKKKKSTIGNFLLIEKIICTTVGQLTRINAAKIYGLLLHTPV